MQDLYKHELNQVKSDTNGVAVALKIISWIVFIGGFIGGIAITGEIHNLFGYGYRAEETAFKVTLLVWAISFVAGVFIMGFSEIIRLLHEINCKQEKSSIK